MNSATRSHRRTYRSLCRTLHRFMREDSDATAGVAAIEFAIIVPMIIFMAVGVFDLGRGFYRKMQVESAAQAGAQYAALHDFNSNSIANAVLSATSFSGISASPAPSEFCGCYSSAGITTVSCNSTCTGGASPGTYATISAQATYTTLISYPGIPSSFQFKSNAIVRLQ